MNINQAHKNWTELGEGDPMWIVLSAEDKRGGKWKKEEFFATGREDIKKALARCHEAGITVNGGSALDFGCGLGRLTQALADHFEQVDGVDVSASMIRQAEAYNTHGEKVRYHLNVKTDLRILASKRFDFIYSALVLQHIPPRDQLAYIAEFMNLLKPGGAAYLQTLRALGLRSLIPNWFVEGVRSVRSRGKAYMPIYGVRKSEVETVIRSNGGQVKKTESFPYSDADSRFASDYFLVVKSQSAG